MSFDESFSRNLTTNEIRVDFLGIFLQIRHPKVLEIDSLLDFIFDRLFLLWCSNFATRCSRLRWLNLRFQFADFILFLLVLVMNQSEQSVVFASEEQKEERLFVHQVLKENLKTEFGWHILFLILEHLEEVVFEVLFVLRIY